MCVVIELSRLHEWVLGIMLKSGIYMYAYFRNSDK